MPNNISSQNICVCWHIPGVLNAFEPIFLSLYYSKNEKIDKNYKAYWSSGYIHYLVLREILVRNVFRKEVKPRYTKRFYALLCVTSLKVPYNIKLFIHYSVSLDSFGKNLLNYFTDLN